MNLENLQRQSKVRHRGKQLPPHPLEKSFIHKRKPFVFKPKPKLIKPKPVDIEWEQKQARIKSLATEINKKLGIENNL